MPKLVLPKTRNQAYRDVLIPMLILALISTCALPFTTVEFALAFMLGGIIWFLPNIYVAYRLFHKIETNPKRFLIIFYRTEIIKLIFVAMLFIVIIKLLSLSFGCLIAGYFLAQFSFWIVAAIDR